MEGNFTVISNDEAKLFQKLKEFYVEICKLTINHDTLSDNAVVYPSKLGPVLEKINKEWYIDALNQN